MIRDTIEPINNKAAHQLQSQYLSDYDYAKRSIINKIRLNKYDKEYFRRLILEERDSNYFEPEPEIVSHRLIQKARHYFVKQFQENCKDKTTDDTFNFSLRIQNILTNHMTVIAVVSDDEDSAAEVFETLNDRGIGLSTPDLLRNFLLRKAKTGNQEDIIELWENVLSFQTDTAIKNFLRQFWVSIYGDVKSQSLYREIKKVVLEKSLDSVKLSQELSDASNLYRDIKEANFDNEICENLSQDVKIFGASGNILYPVILSIFQTLDSSAAITALNALINIFTRDAIIGGIENSRIENRFYKSARNLRSHKDLKKFCNEINEGTINDDRLIISLSQLIPSSMTIARYLLIKFEQSKRSEETTVNSSSKVHVEHIYPKTPQSGSRLPAHEKIINRLGNLTLLGKSFNTSIKNSPFDSKKAIYSRSDILITKELNEYNRWTNKEIFERQEKMSLLALTLWPKIAVD